MTGSETIMMKEKTKGVAKLGMQYTWKKALNIVRVSKHHDDGVNPSSWC
jgi:hypothetical protein